MIPVDEPEVGAIAIIVPTAAMPRYMQFELSLLGLWVTNKSSLSRVQSAALARNLNDGIKNASDEAKFYWFTDDDQKFPPQIAIRLAKLNKPIVVAVTCMSRPPFAPTIYKSSSVDDLGAVHHLPFMWKELDGKSGLMPVHACGRAGMMVRRDVMDAMKLPGKRDMWFRMGHNGNPDEANEDFDFCARAREKGIEILADLDTVQGHMSPCIAWPTMDAYGRWVIRFEWENGQGFTLDRQKEPGA